MNHFDVGMLQQLVAEEIRRVVRVESVERDVCLSIGHSAAQIHRTYPACGMTAEEISTELLAAAIAARIPVEMSRPEVATQPIGAGQAPAPPSPADVLAKSGNRETRHGHFR